MDITERKRAEEALRKERDNAQKYLDVAGVMLVAIDVEGRVGLINKKGCEILGYKEEEIIAKNWFDNFLPQRIKRQVRGVFEKLVGPEADAPEYYENLILTKDGDERLMAWHNTVLRDNKGEVIATLSSGEDITERKKAEEAIKESEERYRLLFEQSPIGIGLSAPNGNVISGNKAMEKITGYSIAELKKINLADTYKNSEDRVTLLEALNREGSLVNYPVQLKRKDGTIYTALLSISRVHFDGNDLFQTTCIDITERKKAEEALRRSQKDWENTFNAISDWIVLIDLKGRILHTNRAGEEFVGVPLAQMAGQTCCKLLHGSDTPLPGCPLLKMLQSGRSENMELQLPDSNRWLAITVDPVIDEKGTLAGAVHITRDITERRHAEDERESTIKLLHLINTNNQVHELMKVTMVFLKDWSDCEAVGIRLQEGDDFPYFETSGFPEDFILAETKLCSVNELGEIERDSQGKPYLECMCGNIISVRFDPSKPFFTEHGSFWTNSTTEFLAGTTEADRLARTRNRCNTAGYESLALVLLRVGKETFGLLQFNDKHKGRFTPEKISLLERLADNLAIGLAQRRAEKALRQSEERFRTVADFTYDWEYWISADKDYIYVSPSCERITKYRAVEFQKNPGLLEQITHPDDRSLIAEHLTEELSIDEMMSLEFRIITRNGEHLWIEHVCQPVYGPDGRYLGRRASNRDITERRKAEEKLFDYQAKLKSLASQLSLIEERERHRLATELHDQIGQALAISKMKLDSLRESVSSGKSADVMGEVSDCLGQIVQDTRTLTFDLSSPILYELGFEAAVTEWLDEQIREKYGIKTDFEDDGQTKPLDDDIRVLLFRDVRELLVNVVKHANAKNVKVSIRKVDDRICVSVEDDGVGFDVTEVESMVTKKAKFGLFSIRERLEDSGGHLEIESEPGHGSRITMVAPLKSK